jgi:alcohol dehydrogenase
MKAAILKSFGSPLLVEEAPPPTLGTGEVLVDVAAAKVLAYAGDVFSGKRQYLITPPLIPGSGGIGRVAAVGLDAAELRVGDWVLCDPTVRARDNAISPAVVLQGLTAGEPRGLGLQKYVPDGCWAERVRVPTENAVPIGAIDRQEAPAWATIGTYLVPYGGLDAAELKAGEIVVVNGATGAFGSAGVAVALAMGAASVIAIGRNRNVLDGLGQRFGSRVRTVAMVGDEAADRAHILEAAPGPIDCVLDLLPPAASAAQVRTALLTVRPFGRVVLMGGVHEDICLPYGWFMRNSVVVRGQFMYSRAAIQRLVALVRAGLLTLDASRIVCFALERVNEAVAHAKDHAAPFEATVLCP